MYHKGQRVHVVKSGGDNCPEVGSEGSILKCLRNVVLVNFDGTAVWCRYSEVRLRNELDDFLNEWGGERV